MSERHCSQPGQVITRVKKQNMQVWEKGAKTARTGQCTAVSHPRL